jgi:2-keto-4-pentenoate hydratase/2-oxohepta-3-ene-1,7-dioic acid hydratase in catechol pathway
VPEGELAVVIGRHTSRVTDAQAPGCIAGYSCANDISARNLEFQTSQWTGGKMLPTFAPLGPAFVTADEIDDVDDLSIHTLLNGTEIQQGNTSGMIFGVYELVSRLSMLVDLEPGDVILTGTPSDLGEVDPPVFLTTGDTIEVLIDGVGRLANPVSASHLSPRHLATAHLKE